MAGSDAVEELGGLRIASLDDDDEEEEEVIDDDEEEESNDFVVLGFVKKPKNSRSLLRHFFPSKAGGLPAWLDPINLPSGRSFLCDICGEPLQFLLQVYAPEDMEYAFHRTIFAFICTSLVCLRRDQHERWKRYPEKPSRSVKVFRCQLPRINPFYSSEPPKKDDKPSGAGATLCTWCGTWKGIIQCPNCKVANYCSEKHRVKHSQLGRDYDCQWVRVASSSGDSNFSGTTTMTVDLQKAACTTIWPEFKIIQEDESAYDTQMSKDNGGANSLVTTNLADHTIMSLMQEFEGGDERKVGPLLRNEFPWPRNKF